MKLTFPKIAPTTITYRNMKNFDRDSFRNELRSNLNKITPKSYGTFEKTFLDVLDNHAPEKEKSIRANHKQYVTKTMRTAIMKRSELATKFRTEPTDLNKKAFKKQKNFCNRLYKKERKKYCENLDLKKITDNKKFWKTVRNLFYQTKLKIHKKSASKRETKSYQTTQKLRIY